MAAAEAGVRGRRWLQLDAQLKADWARVRIGNVVGRAAAILVGLGQGRRAAGALLGALTKALTSQVEEACLPAAAALPEAARIGLNRESSTAPLTMDTPDQDVPPVAELRDLLEGLQEGPGHAADWAAALRSIPTSTGRALFLDLAGRGGHLVSLFIDDLLVLQSSLWGTRRAAEAFTSFVRSWSHAFAKGTKRLKVMAVGAVQPSTDQLGTVAGETMAAADQEDPVLKALGVPIDGDLTFNPLLGQVVAKIREAAPATFAAAESSGFGLPFLVDQWESKVRSKALYGAEFLASHEKGWPTVAAAVTRAQYAAAKILLGLEKGDSLPGFFLAFRELRMGWRLEATLAYRIIMLRARITLLPTNHPLSRIISAVVGAGVQNTWWGHAGKVMREWGVNGDAGDWLQEKERGCAVERRKAAALFKRQVVKPAIVEAEGRWAREHFAKITSSTPPHPFPVPYKKLPRSAAIPRGYPMSLRWACWGPSHWKWYRRWLLSRMGCPRLAMAVGLRGQRAGDEERCPLCGEQVAHLTLHIIAVCESTADIRGEYEEGGGSLGTDGPDLLWAFESRCAPEALRRKVRLVGRIMGRAGLARSVAAAEELQTEDPKRKGGDEQGETGEGEKEGEKKRKEEQS